MEKVDRLTRSALLPSLRGRLNKSDLNPHAQGRIVASVHDAGDVCRIVIADSGPGIPPEIREKIFTPFFTTKSRGTGLGLPTVKRLIDAHRGRITIECPPAGGTHVAIDLPRTWSHS